MKKALTLGVLAALLSSTMLVSDAQTLMNWFNNRNMYRNRPYSVEDPNAPVVYSEGAVVKPVVTPSGQQLVSPQLTDVPNVTKEGILIPTAPYWREYVDNLNRQVATHWHAEDMKNVPSGNAKLVLTILKDGKLAATQVQHSSGNVQYDRLVQNAVEMSAPFAPLPVEYEPESVNILFSFQFANERVNNR